MTFIKGGTPWNKGKYINEQYKRYGEWYVNSIAYIKKEVYWNVTCNCGKTSIVRGSKLRSGNTESCKSCCVNSGKFKKDSTPWNKGLIGRTTKIKTIIRDLQCMKDWRYSVYKKHNNTCVNCGMKQSENKKNVHAHHRIPLVKIIEGYNINTYEEAMDCKLLWDIRNGVVLCEDCHKRVHINKYDK